jgi:hypothetical protein
MSGHSGSTSTNNVSQDPTTIFAAPHPPARKDATVDGASVPSAQKVYTLDEEDMDDSDRAWLAQMRKKHEASREFTAKQDQLLNRKKLFKQLKLLPIASSKPTLPSSFQLQILSVSTRCPLKRWVAWYTRARTLLLKRWTL